MSQSLQTKATAILEVVSNKGTKAGRPCPACGMMMSLPESSPHLAAPPVR